MYILTYHSHKYTQEPVYWFAMVEIDKHKVMHFKIQLLS